MITCQYCAHKNEDGTLFCERCKSDLLSQPEAKPMSEVMPAPITVPMGEVPMAEPVLADTASYDSVKHEVAPPSTGAVETASYHPVRADAGEAKPSGDPVSVPNMSTPKLMVIRGQKLNVEYPIYTGDNFIGRTDEKPVDIDLEDQESQERIWCSRQHARIVSDDKGLSIEDLGSQNGTFVNRARIYPGQLRPLENGDVIQIGTVQMKLKLQ
ncbi:MAG: FHA domain-containing protein [Gemmatales bacterium]